MTTGISNRMAACLVMALAGALADAATPAAAPAQAIDQATLDQWSAKFRNWHYWPGHVVGPNPKIEGVDRLLGTDVPTLVALLVCLIPTTIGALLAAIGIAGMDRALRANIIAKSGKAVEVAGDVS